MREIAEFLAAERVVSEVLDDGAPVCIGVRLLKLIVRQSRKSLEKQEPDLIFPQQVNDFLMRQNRLSKRGTTTQE